ncbi:hypothetical protein DWY69_23290, partial [Eisenbergiella massiliensis]
SISGEIFIIHFYFLYSSFLYSLFVFIIMTVSYLISYVTRRAALCCGDCAPYCFLPPISGWPAAVWGFFLLHRKNGDITY